MTWLTGGTDGLHGVDTWPIFGVFGFDLWGYTAYAYALAVLFLGFLVSRRIVNSSFGLALRGIRENVRRMPAIGSDYRAHLRKIYTISAAMAGVAGALLTQTTETVSLDTLSFQRSADVVVMLILGGTGRLYGAHRRRDHLHAGARPARRHEPAILVFLDRAPADGRRARHAAAAFSAASPASSGRRATDGRGRDRPARPRRCDKSFGSLQVARDVSIALPRGARHALIGPNGAGKTTLINLITGQLAPDSGRILLDGDGRHPRPGRRAGAPRPDPHLPDQHALPRPHADRGGDAGDLRARARGRPVLAQPRRARGRDRRGLRDPRPAAPRRRRHAPDPHPALRPAAAARDRAGARHPAAACCCSTSPPPACRRTRAPRSSRVIAALARGHLRALHRARHGHRLQLRHAHHRAGRRAACCSRPTPRSCAATRACARSISARPAMAEPLLELRDVRAGYGEAVVLDGVSLALPADGSLAVLGRNGVGKTTLLLDRHGLRPARARLRPLAGPRHLAAAAAPARPRSASAGCRRSATSSPR